MTRKIEGQLEIDTDRGVIYFHSNTTGTTVLRICNLDLPKSDFDFLDITFGLHIFSVDSFVRKGKRDLIQIKT